MPERAIASWVVLVALVGCSPPSEPDTSGKGPANVPAAMPDARPSKPVGTAEERAKQVADRLKQAANATAEKKYDAAIDQLREAIMIEPKDRKVLMEIAKAYQARSLAVTESDPAEAYRSGVGASEYLRTLRDYYPDQTDEEKKLAAEIHLGEATQQAMSLRVEETTAALNDAIGAGFKDFDRIRNDPRWKKMLDQPLFQKAFPDLAKKP